MRDYDVHQAFFFTKCVEFKSISLLNNIKQ